jgi:hypothetical protein
VVSIPIAYIVDHHVDHGNYKYLIKIPMDSKRNMEITKNNAKLVGHKKAIGVK